MLTEFQFETTHFNTEHSAKVPPPLHPTQFNAFSKVECVPKARTTCTIWREFSVGMECGLGTKTGLLQLDLEDPENTPFDDDSQVLEKLF